MIIKNLLIIFFNISLGSSFELQTQILLANHRKYLSDYLKVSKK